MVDKKASNTRSRHFCDSVLRAAGPMWYLMFARAQSERLPLGTRTSKAPVFSFARGGLSPLHEQRSGQRTVKGKGLREASVLRSRGERQAETVRWRRLSPEKQILKDIAEGNF